MVEQTSADSHNTFSLRPNRLGGCYIWVKPAPTTPGLRTFQSFIGLMGGEGNIWVIPNPLKSPPFQLQSLIPSAVCLLPSALPPPKKG